jgi:hypothetical protein
LPPCMAWTGATGRAWPSSIRPGLRTCGSGSRSTHDRPSAIDRSDGHEHVHALGAAGLDRARLLGVREHLADQMRGAHRQREPVRGRAEVEHQVGGLRPVAGPRIRWTRFVAAELAELYPNGFPGLDVENSSIMETRLPGCRPSELTHPNTRRGSGTTS